jgi:hypothetical protein
MRPTDNNRFVYNGILTEAKEVTQETKNGNKQMCRFLVQSEKLDAEDFPQTVINEFTTFNRSQIARVMCCANGVQLQITGYLESTPGNDGRYFANQRVSGIKVPEAAAQAANDRLAAERAGTAPKPSDGLNFGSPASAAPANDPCPF